MAYATGVSASINDVMAAVRTFAQAQGFTVSATWATGGVQQPSFQDFGPLTAMAISKAGVFYHFAWNDTFVLMDTSTASAGSGMPWSQVGADPNMQVVGPFKGPHIGYHLFSQGTRVHGVVEYATNVFIHFSFGAIDKVGNWEGGQYVSGSFWSRQLQPSTPPTLYAWNQYVHSRPFESIAGYGANALVGNASVYSVAHMRATYENKATMQFGYGTYLDASTNTGQWSAWAYGNELLEDSPNMFNNRSALVPLQVNMQTIRGETTESAMSRMQLGQLSDVAAINMSLINPKDMINNDWMAFPVSQKNGDGVNFVNSGIYGLAYKK